MREQMLEYGIDVYPVADGQLHRFKGPDDKRQNGWYVLYHDFGAFGNWKTGITVKWSERRKLSDQERRDLNHQIRTQCRQRQKEREQRQHAAAEEAGKIWRYADVVVSHPYLQRKQVQAHGIRQADDALIIPMYRGRQLRSIQRIYPDGRKRFLKDGDIYAAYHPIGKLRERLWIAEGFATSASVFEATGDAVACAFSGANMAKVAKAFRKQHPKLDIRIAGDVGGEKYADEAMIACLGKRALPIFDDGDDGNDWNDFSCLYGKDTTRNALHGRI